MEGLPLKGAMLLNDRGQLCLGVSSRRPAPSQPSPALMFLPEALFFFLFINRSWFGLNP